MTTATSALIARMLETGWAFVKAGSKHEVWHCPCGEHTATISRSRSKGAKEGPIMARINRCQRQRVLTRR